MIHSIYSMIFITFLLALQGIVASTSSLPSQPKLFTVLEGKGEKEFDVVEGIADANSGLAYGSYYVVYNNSGWSHLDAHAQLNVDTVEKHLQSMKALGYLEGYATCQELNTFYPNFYSNMFGTSTPGPKTMAFLQANYQWLVAESDKNYLTSDYWYSVKATLNQLNGVLEGFKGGCGVKKHHILPDYSTLDDPTLQHFLLLNAWGDLYQITAKFFEPGAAKGLPRRKRPALKELNHNFVERCSAIIKLLPDFSDVYYTHATWDTYESAGPRIIKHYNFRLMRGGQQGLTYDVHFSSSPGLLSSVDDFFIVSGYAQLGVIETTNNLYNVSLFDVIVPSTVLSWTRAVVSNQLANNGYNWAENFAQYQSGTYTNQWMSIDLNLFTPGQAPKPGFLTVFEEVPGTAVYQDQTVALVENGYWASYNIPFYPEISELSGNAALCEHNSVDCHDTAPRAQQFAKLQSSIVDLSSLEWVIGYNEFQTDATSLNDSCNAIACRGDLEPELMMRGAYGAIDGKATSVLLSRREPGVSPDFYARFGPTHDEQATFCWSTFKQEAAYSHQGQPDCFDYDWQLLPPRQ